MRTNTNKYVYRKAEMEINRNREPGQSFKTIARISEFYETQRSTLIADTVNASPADPIRAITMEADGYGWFNSSGLRV